MKRLALIAAGVGTVCALLAGSATSRTAVSSNVAATPKTTECAGIPLCASVKGPWVIVPARGEATFALECPRRRSPIGGLDALATSSDIRVTWEAQLGNPVSRGTALGKVALFHAVSASGRRGAFRPIVGCVLTNPSGPSTTAADVTAPGAHLDWWQTSYRLHPGTIQATSRRCLAHERLVGGWTALFFKGSAPPNVALAGAVQLRYAIHGARVVGTSTTEARLPYGAQAGAQVGATCAP